MPPDPPHQCRVIPFGVIWSPDVASGGQNFFIVKPSSIDISPPQSTMHEPAEPPGVPEANSANMSLAYFSLIGLLPSMSFGASYSMRNL